MLPVSYRVNGPGHLTPTSPTVGARDGPPGRPDSLELAQRVRSGQRLAEIAAGVHAEADDTQVAPADASRESAPPPVTGQRLIARVHQAPFGPDPSYARPIGELPQTIDSLAEKLEISAEDLYESLQDGSFRQRLTDSGFEARLGILVNRLL